MPLVVGSPYFTSCDELFSGRTGTPMSRTGERTYLRRFLVIVKDQQMSDVSVTLCPGLPAYNSLYITPTEFDLQALAVDFRTHQQYDDDWQNWIVEVNYSTIQPAGGPRINGSPATQNGTANNPQNEPADVSWDFEVSQISPPYDLDHKPILNSAKQPFSPPQTFPVGYPILEITRNELLFDPTIAIAYAFALNHNWFLGAPPNTVQCMPPKARQAYRGNIRYWRVAYRFKFGYLVDQSDVISIDGVLQLDPDYQEDANENPIGLRNHQPLVLDHGSEEHIVPAEGQAGPSTLRPITKDGVKVDALLRNGREVQINEISKIKEPNYLRFRMYHQADFAELFTQGFQNAIQYGTPPPAISFPSK